MEMLRNFILVLLVAWIMAACSEKTETPPDDPELTVSERVDSPADSLGVAASETSSVAATGMAGSSSESMAGRNPPPRINFSPTGRYILQVGAYRNRESADQAAMDLKLMGYPAQVVSVGAVFRVRIGFFERVSDARALGERLSSQVGLKYWVDNR